MKLLGSILILKLNVITANLASLSWHRKNILIGDINADDVKGLKSIILLAKVENLVVHWNCQDYILEILDKLAKECIVEEDEKQYKKARKELDKAYGARI